MSERTATTLAERPAPRAPRPYEFPAVAEHRLANGLRILAADMPGRPLIAASLVLRNGAVDEPADVAGATVLAARALSEGTERYDAIELTEASERIGASLHAEAGWDALTASVDVPRDRLEAALVDQNRLMRHEMANQERGAPQGRAHVGRVQDRMPEDAEIGDSVLVGDPAAEVDDAGHVRRRGHEAHAAQEGDRLLRAVVGVVGEPCGRQQP